MAEDIVLPLWTPDDGPIKYVYRDKPAGHRCMWACRWAMLFVREQPEQIAPLDKLTQDQAFYELLDASRYKYTSEPTRKEIPEDWHNNALHVLFEAGALGVTGLDLEAAHDVLAVARNGEYYPEFVANWNPPIPIPLKKLFRPGWYMGDGPPPA